MNSIDDVWKDSQEYWKVLSQIMGMQWHEKRMMAALLLGWKSAEHRNSENGYRRLGVFGSRNGGRSVKIPRYESNLTDLLWEIQQQGWEPSTEHRFHLNLGNIFATRGFRDYAQVLVNSTPEDWCSAFIMTGTELEKLNSTS